jgi:hypothetical protein
MPKRLPVPVKPFPVTADALYWGAFACLLLEDLGIDAEVTVGDPDGDFCEWRGKNGSIRVNITVGGPLRTLHEVGHALLGPSEASAAAWSRKVLSLSVSA